MDKTAAQQEKQVVVFNLGPEDYAVDIGIVREIIRMQNVTRVPRTPQFIEGVINLRGKIIPVVNLRKRFGLPGDERGKDNRIIVVDLGRQSIGIIVDAVTQVFRVPDGSIEAVSDAITTTEAECLLGIAKIGSRLIILLDLHRMFSAAEGLPEPSAASVLAG